MPISPKFLIAAFSLPLLALFSSGVSIRPSHAQPPPADICTNREYPREPVSSNSKTHVVADGYQFDYPANYRLLLKNDGSIFVTDERNYQYFQCLLEHRPPTEFLPNGITISWRTAEQLNQQMSGNEISRETISGRTATFFILRRAHDDFIETRIPSRGGYVVISTTIDNNQILMEDAFRRVLTSIVVP